MQHIQLCTCKLYSCKQNLLDSCSNLVGPYSCIPYLCQLQGGRALGGPLLKEVKGFCMHACDFGYDSDVITYLPTYSAWM